MLAAGVVASGADDDDQLVDGPRDVVVLDDMVEQARLPELALGEVERIGREGRIAVLELETEGALKVAEELSGVVTVFVTAPRAELERRLRERATESAGEIGERLDLAESQLLQASLFDHVVENDDVQRAVDELVAIVEAVRKDRDDR